MKQIKISSKQFKRFKKIVSSFNASVPAQGHWKKWKKNNDLWMQMFKQIAVVGNRYSIRKLKSRPDLKKLISYDSLLRSKNPKKDIHRVIREIGVRYAARDIKKCNKTNSIYYNLNLLKKHFNKKTIKMLEHIAQMKTTAEKVNYLKQFKYFGDKGSRDFLIDAGLAKDVIAFDTQILQIFKKIGVKLPNKVYKAKQMTISSTKLYQELERTILEEVCVSLSINGNKLDRLLFKNQEEILKMNF